MLPGPVGPFLLALAAAATLSPRLPAQNAPEKNESPGASDRVRINGRVIDDATGKPVAGAIVQLTEMVIRVSLRYWTPSHEPAPAPQPPTPPQPREMITGADGEFTFDDVPMNTMELRATKPGYADVWGFRRDAEDHLGTYLPGDLSGPITLRLAPVSSISGVIRNHEGGSMGKMAQVVLWRLRAWAGWPRLEYGGWPTFAEDGTYHFDNLPPGRYYMTTAREFDGKVHARFKDGHVVGDVTERYPAPSDDDPSPFFILHEGEQAHVDFQLPEASLHRVTLTGDR
jgi:hypothetical protein